MIWQQMDISKDDKNKFYGNFNLSIEDNKEEIAFAQRVFALDGEFSICSKTLMPFLEKYGSDIIEFVKEKYPEDIIGDDFQSVVKFIETINAN